MRTVTIQDSTQEDEKEPGFFISGIKCDHCNYSDMEVPFDNFPNYIDAPCPLCGFNLLTRADYNICVRQYRIMWYFESAGKYLKWLNPFHYWRLITGKSQKKYNMTIEWKNK